MRLQTHLCRPSVVMRGIALSIAIASLLALASCSTAMPYVTEEVTTDEGLLSLSEFEDLASVPGFRKWTMNMQLDTYGCAIAATSLLVGWSRHMMAVSKQRASIDDVFEVPNIAPDEFRANYPQTLGGYVPSHVVVDHFNRLPAGERGHYTMSEVTGADMSSLIHRLHEGAPVMVPYMLSGIPWYGRIWSRVWLTVLFPVDRLAYLLTFGSVGLQRKLLNGEDDVFEHYLHAGCVVAVVKRKRDGARFVVIGDPWCGDKLAFAAPSRGFEVLSIEEFERRWMRWHEFGIPEHMLGKWHRLASPGSMLVLDPPLNAARGDRAVGAN